MTLAFGNYQLIKKLATGGMAEVWLARQKGIEGFNRHVVVKRILPHLAEDPEFVQMFLNEAKIASRFNHPNIAQIYDLGETGGQYYIAMEFIHGEDLGRVMRRAWSTEQWVARHIALRIVADACQGLHYAHTRLDERGQPLRVVHRDISPQNILISFDGAVKVVDFGIAKASDQASNTRSGALKGKFAYMSPEQAAGKALDARSDLFALGLVLYELITGVRPLKRDSELATLQAALEGVVDPPSAVAEIAPELDDIVMKALAKNPDDRYADTKELQRALEQFLLDAKELATSSEVSDLMSALFADRLNEEAKLGTPNPSSDSSTGTPAQPSVNTSQPSMTESSKVSKPIRANAAVTLEEEPSVPNPVPDDDDDDSVIPIPQAAGSPAATMAPGLSVDEDPTDEPDVSKLRHTEGTSTSSRRSPTGGLEPRQSRTELAVPSEEPAEEPPPPEPPPRSVRRSRVGSSGGSRPSLPPEEEVSKRRKSSGAIRRKSASGMPDAPPRRSRPVADRQDSAPVGPSAVELEALKERQRSRLKALVAVVLLLSSLTLLFVFRSSVMALLQHKVTPTSGIPIRLSVSTNPPTMVYVLPGPHAEDRRPIEFGRTPVDEVSGVYVGDTIRLVNEEQGLTYEELISSGFANDHHQISKTFRETSVKVRTNPPLKNASVWRGGRRLGLVGSNLALFPGTHHLEIRSEQLPDPVPFQLSFAEGSKNLEWPVDVASQLERR